MSLHEEINRAFQHIYDAQLKIDIISVDSLAEAARTSFGEPRPGPHDDYGARETYKRMARRWLAGRTAAKNLEFADADDQHELWPDLQRHYPQPETSGEWKRLEALTEPEGRWNVAQLRKQQKGAGRHADTLEAWLDEKFGPQPAMGAV